MDRYIKFWIPQPEENHNLEEASIMEFDISLGKLIKLYIFI